MIALWLYHWRMGRTVERLFLMATFDRIMGPERMRNARADLAFASGEQWSAELLASMAIQRRLYESR